MLVININKLEGADMFKIIRESFSITNNYIIIATPLILFSLITSLYMIFSGHGSNLGLIFSVVLFCLMVAAFLSGWFFMIVKAVQEPDGKSSLLSEFPAGVGEYFVPILGFLFNTFIISSVIIIGAFLFGKKFIGNAGITANELSAAFASVEAMKSFASSLSDEQLMKINQWNLLLFSTMIFNYFILMFYAPTMFFKRKNPFVALWLSIRDLFSARFFKNVGLFCLIFVTYMILSAFNALFGSNIIVHFILTLINFYYVTYVAILIFNYYYANFAKIGSNVDKVV